MELAKRWRWLGIEFIVIVLGVLSALFVDTRVEDREKAGRAEIYRERLILDIRRATPGTRTLRREAACQYRAIDRLCQRTRPLRFESRPFRSA